MTQHHPTSPATTSAAQLPHAPERIRRTARGRCPMGAASSPWSPPATSSVVGGRGCDLPPYLPVFLQQEAGASLWWIGVIAGAYFVGVFAVSPAAGRLSDRVGRKPLLVGGTLVYAVSTLLFITTTEPALFVLFRLLEGVGVALIVPAGQAFIAEITTDRNRSQAYGWWTTAQFGGLLVGPALAWPLYEARRRPGALGFLYHLPRGIGAVAPGRRRAGTVRPRAGARGTSAAAPGDPPLPCAPSSASPILAILLVVATAEFAMGAWEVVWSLWLVSLGHSFAFIGLTWIAFSAPMLLAFAGGRLADRYSRYLLMIAGFTVQALMWFVFALNDNPAVYIGAGVMGGLAPSPSRSLRSRRSSCNSALLGGWAACRGSSRRPCKGAALHRHADGAAHLRRDRRLDLRGLRGHRADRRASRRPGAPSGVGLPQTGASAQLCISSISPSEAGGPVADPQRSRMRS